MPGKTLFYCLSFFFSVSISLEFSFLPNDCPNLLRFTTKFLKEVVCSHSFLKPLQLSYHHYHHHHHSTWISHKHIKSHMSKIDLLYISSVPVSVNSASGTQLAKLKCGCHPLPLPLPHATSHPLLLNIIALKMKTKMLNMVYKALYILAPLFQFYCSLHHIHL